QMKPKHRHSLHDGVNAVLRALPGVHDLVSHRRLAKRLAKLSTSPGVPGPHNFCVRRPPTRLAKSPRPPHSSPTSVTPDTPLDGLEQNGNINMSRGGVKGQNGADQGWVARRTCSPRPRGSALSSTRSFVPSLTELRSCSGKIDTWKNASRERLGTNTTTTKT